jgi:hypothetical protein
VNNFEPLFFFLRGVDPNSLHTAHPTTTTTTTTVNREFRPDFRPMRPFQPRHEPPALPTMPGMHRSQFISFPPQLMRLFAPRVRWRDS